MSREYDIFSKQDFDKMVHSFNQYFKGREAQGLPFQKIKIISKRWRDPKTSKQHRTYWRCIGELKKAFINAGYDVNEHDVHHFVKVKSGFTKIINCVIIPKSVSNLSDDATKNEMNKLIEFIQRFAMENLNYNIDIGDY